MTALWATVLAEPRWLVIVGLAFDAIGAVLVAITAWLRIGGVAYLGEGTGRQPGPLAMDPRAAVVHEEPAGLVKRRWLVFGGASLLVVGFSLQGIAAMMQMGRGHPGYWTI